MGVITSWLFYNIMEFSIQVTTCLLLRDKFKYNPRLVLKFSILGLLWSFAVIHLNEVIYIYYLIGVLLEDFGGTSLINNASTSRLSSSFSSLPITFKRSYSSNNLPLNPWFVTGFVDAEGCFLVSIVKNDELRTGWEVIARFKIGLHTKDYLLLEQIKTYFGVGAVTFDVKNNSCVFEVTNLEGIIYNILAHFYKHPLISKKLADYLLFK